MSKLDSLFCEVLIFDVNTNLSEHLVINTCGPFQNTNYHIAKQCIVHGIYYIDLADGRDFVSGISTLNESANAAGIAVISGASSGPSLSSAVIEY